jgi:hypothetical protein
VNKARDSEFYSLKPEVVVGEPVPLAMMLMSSANGGETSVLYRSYSARTAVRSEVRVGCQMRIRPPLAPPNLD